MYHTPKKFKGKIMVLGYLGAKIDDYLVIAAYYNVPRDAITFVNDPNNFRIKKIYDSEYTDIIFAAWPHHVQGSNANNLPRTILNNPEHYPNLLTKAQSGTSLKRLSITDFEHFLKQTKYFKINNIKTRPDLDKAIEKSGLNTTVLKTPKSEQSINKSNKKPRTGTTVSNWFKKFDDKISK